MSVSITLILNGDLQALTELAPINEKYNRYEYVTDYKNFGKADYWQNPYEFSTYKKGDCEDYAIAKFFDLVNIGVPEDRLLIVYTRYIPNNEAHMVLFVMIGNEWFVMDNVTDVIQPVAKRTDLELVYGFNTVVNFDMRRATWRQWDLAKTKAARAPVKRLKELLENEITCHRNQCRDVQR